MGDVFICKCGAVAECHPDIAGHLEYIECPECKLATPAIDTATMEGAAKLISTWEWLGGAVEYPEPVTAKESLAVRGLYAVFADNGNVICFSQLRSHASLLKLEAEGREVVVLVEAGRLDAVSREAKVWEERCIKAEMRVLELESRQESLAAVRQYRIGVTPEFEGQWHADLYGHDEEPQARAGGDTPELAVLAVISAFRTQQGGAA